ncbi:3-oxoacyl-ACP synthase III family protein [Yoonia sediminilitoris]|uniref:3-oxoacyl-[acyl-carrier-protein] synthase-3 n=1 Tax=Yoonia sediminilitoris TaxID=1286148 RepID=A0A2T6KMR8_9RHOB|nr:3-oxoacyl-ACP synthase [Yoonia sediminilitoris]PUB17515.1 3-oxoacyl-[acyl-carrier-protein] synthase-3 [Yoonia sediminilitoris]RCW97810.1 3-oxoacyl-[acyl-carrier-protein] synthase-3 [Yoonia sediminilitoris]
MTAFVPRILGTGHTVPGKIRLNDDPIFDWIKKNNPAGLELFAGYDKRHVLSEGECMIDIMLPAAQLALKNAGIRPDQVDLLIGDGSIGAYVTPNTISELHHRLGLPARALPLPVGNNFSQFNAGMMIADALIRAGRATYVLIVLGDNWTRYVDYHTAQAVSAADGAAACVIGPSDNAACWHFVDEITVADTSYYGSMFMAPDLLPEKVQDGGGLPDSEYTHPYFHITEEGIKGFTEFGVNTSADAVAQLLARNRVDAKDICLLTHQASTKLMDHWKDVIKPGCYVQTIAQYANMVQCSVLFNLSWGAQNANDFTQDWLVVLCLGPDMHANAMLMRRN